MGSHSSENNKWNYKDNNLGKHGKFQINFRLEIHFFQILNEFTSLIFLKFTFLY